MNLKEKLENFDPNNLGDTSGNIFGLPFDINEAQLVILPVPWEVTVSYSSGTANAPEAIFEASFQVDLYDPAVEDAWKAGIAMDAVNQEIKTQSDLLRVKAEKYIAMLTEGISPDENMEMIEIRDEINGAGFNLNAWVKSQALGFLKQHKLVALLGGDHSTPLGLIQALADKYQSFSILHIDAHADLRKAYEGFEFSHASIMFNALKIPQVTKLVQAGIRDYCEDEVKLINSDNRIVTYFDRDIKHSMYEGKSWSAIVNDILADLTEDVYISIDIDGLDPKLCPGTGTPVPGGFEFEQITYLIEKLVKTKRRIIGFDLNEVSPRDDEWDANVGARILYRVANLAIKSFK
ncbi:MAG TPA: agmatinase family protein [Lentimicrobium sp.]|nr:agmatinase family protein [Lentimicrobium sp.]